MLPASSAVASAYEGGFGSGDVAVVLGSPLTESDPAESRGTVGEREGLSHSVCDNKIQCTQCILFCLLLYLRNCGIHAVHACHGTQEPSGCACGKQGGRDRPCTDEQQAKKRGARSNADL